MTAAALIASIGALLLWGTSGIFDKLTLNSMPGKSPLTAVFIRMAIASVLLMLIGCFTGLWDNIAHMPAMTATYLVVSALLAAVLGQVAYFYAVSHDEASRVVVFCSAYPLVTVLAAAAILGEALTYAKLIGALLVIAGLILLAGPRRRRP